MQQVLAFMTFILLMTGCGININEALDSTNSSTADNTAADEDVGLSLNLNLTIQNVYPSNGADWNDYVENDGNTEHSGSDTACNADSIIDGTGPRNGSTVGYDACINGAEKKKVSITELTSCTGLTLVDNLGVFNWTCDDSTSNVIFYSTKFNTGKGLKDLVNASSWKENFVSLSGSNSTYSSITGTSASEAWWSNIVEPLADNSGSGDSVISLSDAGKVYTLSSDRDTKGYNINADKVSIVTINDATLSHYTSASTNCNYSTGETVTPNRAVVICVGSQNYAWIEATIDGNNSNNGIIAALSNFLYIRNTSIIDVTASNGDSIWLLDLLYSRIVNLVANGSQKGIYQQNTCHYNYFENIVLTNHTDASYASFTVNGNNHHIEKVYIANNDGGGMNLAGRDILVADTFIFNNGTTGIYTNNLRNKLVNIVAAFNGANGVNYLNTSTGGEEGFMSMVTSIYNGQDGLNMSGYNNSINNFLSVGNAQEGLHKTNGGSSDVYTNVAMSDHSSKDIRIDSGTSDFNGHLLVYDNTSCLDTGATGVTDNTCVLDGGSSGTLTYQGTFLADFVQNISSDDSTNSSDSNGSATYPGTPLSFDWTTFESPYRVWGVWGTAGRWTSGAGNIVDLRLLSTGNKIFNNTEFVSSNNASFTPNSACPSAIDGSVSSQDDDGNDYLINAYEIVTKSSDYYSSTGDHDGFCESNETCIYSPNFGAYQGHGNLASCAFSDGTITGVTMYGYENNGI